MSFLKSFGEASSALGRGVGHAQPHLEQWAQKSYEHGALQAMQGGEAPSRGYHATKAYETTLGEVTAKREYRSMLEDYYVENRALRDPEEFQMGLQELSQQFLEGQTENFLQGFLPSAMGFESQVLSKFDRDLRTEQMKKNHAVIDQYFLEELPVFMDSLVAQQYGETRGYTTLAELSKDDIFAERNFLEQKHVQEEINRGLRDTLSIAQERGEDMGIPKHEVNEQFLDFLLREAEKGYPELLDVLFETDKDGISLVSALGHKRIVDSYERAQDQLAYRLEMAGRELLAEEQAELEAELEADKLQARMEFQDYTQALMAIKRLDDPLEIEERAFEIQQKFMSDPKFREHMNDGQVNELLGRVFRAYDVAVDAREDKERMLRVEEERRKEAAIENLYNQFLVQVYEAYKLPTTEERGEAVKKIEQFVVDAQGEDQYNVSLPSNITDRITKDLRHLRERVDPVEPVKNDLVVFNEYWSQLKVDQEPLGNEGLSRLLRDQAEGYINQTTAEQIIRMDADLRQAIEEEWSPERQRTMIDRSVRAIGNILASNTDFVATFFGDDGDEVAELILYFDNWADSYQHLHQTEPTYKEFQAEANAVLADHGTSLEEIFASVRTDPNVERDVERLEQQYEGALTPDQQRELERLEVAMGMEGEPVATIKNLVSRIPFVGEFVDSAVHDYAMLVDELGISEDNPKPMINVFEFPQQLDTLVENGTFATHADGLKYIEQQSRNGNLEYPEDHVKLYYFSYLINSVAPRVDMENLTNVFELRTRVNNQLETEGISDDWSLILSQWIWSRARDRR